MTIFNLTSFYGAIFYRRLEFEVKKLRVPVKEKIKILEYFDVSKFMMFQEQNLFTEYKKILKRLFMDIFFINAEIYWTFGHVHRKRNCKSWTNQSLRRANCPGDNFLGRFTRRGAKQIYPPGLNSDYLSNTNLFHRCIARVSYSYTNHREFSIQCCSDRSDILFCQAN